MIYKYVKKEDCIELEEISFDEGLELVGKVDFHFDSEIECLNFYKEVLKRNSKSKCKKRKEDFEIYAMLPYLKDEDLHEIVSSIIDGESESLYQMIDLNELLPYLNEEDVDLLLMKSASENHLTSYFNELLPFASSEGLSRLVDEYVKGNFQSININDIYPYLESQDIKKIFQFASSEGLSRLVDEYMKGNFQNINMNDLYPYLESKDIKRIFQYYLSKKKMEE
ncbi:MAG: hypothetical protein K2I42_06355 [Anaeroplasmataceae bacterium]|nr:hypothetical protein [Anaeroplasmataceae bacterium]